MLYNVFLWLTSASRIPDAFALAKAEKNETPFDLVQSVMQCAGYPSAFRAVVERNDDSITVGEFWQVTCVAPLGSPESEVSS